jgi:glucokinase
MALLLAGDLGGTTTRLGLFEAAPGRPRAIVSHSYTTLAFDGLVPMVAEFLRAAGRTGGEIGAACFGVAGPIVERTARLSNVPWVVDADRMSLELGIHRVALINDLVALAYAIGALRESERLVLQAGEPDPAGNRALIAAGTGLGEALLHRIDGRFVPSPSEAGHADFAARSDEELDLVRDLTSRYGRAMVEHVVSGPGMVNLYRFTHGRAGVPCKESVDPASPGAPAAISVAGATGRCAACTEAVRLFVDAYGAAAGNLALRTLATGGVYIGGGIAPKMLTAIQSGSFMTAFCAKAPFEALMRRIPVFIILEPDAGLLGAATCAAGEGSS